MVAAQTQALLALAKELGEWSELQRGLWTQGTARVRAALEQIEQERARRATAVAALEAMLAAAPEEERARIGAQLMLARESLQRADRARAVAVAAEQQFQGARSRAGYGLQPAIEKAREDLSRRVRLLDEYASVSAPAISAAPLLTPSSSGGGLASALSARGMQMVPLSEVDFSDNPIVGDFGRGGAALKDYRWAAEMWESVVKPGIEAGMTRDDFAARDAAREAQPLRRTADVYDMFLGGDAIHLSRRPNGTLDPGDGRHRIQAARDQGVDELPGRLT